MNNTNLPFPIFWYVYILKCSDNRPYTGYTSNLLDRLARHQRGSVPATVNRRPVEIISFFSFSNKYQAIDFEKYLKSGSGRAFLYKRLYLYK